MLTRLMVKNFKSIGEPGIDIELRPLTIFVGPNGGGKSSILEALAFLAQNVERETNNLTLAGDLAFYSDFSSIAHRADQTKWCSLGVRSDRTDLGYRFDFKPDTGEAKESTLKEDLSLFIGITMRGDRRHGYELVVSDAHRTSQSVSVGWLRLLDPLFLLQMGKASQYPGSASLEVSTNALKAFAIELKGNVFFLTGLRGKIPPQVGAGQDATWVGRDCENVLVVLARAASPTYEGVNRQILQWASKFQISRVWAGATAANVLAGQFVDPELSVPLNLSLASLGSRQVLGMITQLFWAKPGSTVMIEEPELSLHPEAQDKLPVLFADAIKDGKQVMITTHSHYLLLALTEAVKAGLPAKDIAVYEVKKEPETGTTAKRLPVSKEGYIRNWISSFNDVDQELFERRTAMRKARSGKR